MNAIRDLDPACGMVNPLLSMSLDPNLSGLAWKREKPRSGRIKRGWRSNPRLFRPRKLFYLRNTDFLYPSAHPI